MDPDPFASRYSQRDLNYIEWTPVSPTTTPEEAFNKPQRSPSPPKRPRNAKNLSLNVPPGSAVASLPISAPASPFRSPRLPTRRPSNLTINIHSLHRHPSTPELYTSKIRSSLVSSPAPYTSNQFPRLDEESHRVDSERPKTRHTDPTVHEIPYAESVEREKAYPDGPRVILEPNIWLYAEPDLELAKTYDVIINVAKEVENPFLVTDTLDPSRLSPPYDLDSTPSPFSPFSSETSSMPSSTSSGLSTSSPRLPPKTTEPAAPTIYKYNNVEYMHVPWDHNSSLSQDLPGIVDYILERSAQDKKVLVHCQVSPIIALLTSSAVSPAQQL
jgi:tyrosine-protein phosphatase